MWAHYLTFYNPGFLIIDRPLVHLSQMIGTLYKNSSSGQQISF